MIKKTIITIQPKQRGKNGVLPYPFFIDELGFVGRQDFWKGEPYKLIGFDISPEDHNESGKSIDLQKFLKNPKLCVGMFPIFSNKNGQWLTYSDPIEAFKVAHVEVDEKPVSKAEKKVVSRAKSHKKK